jgi:hypothetical protein
MSIIRHCRECGKEITLHPHEEGEVIGCPHGCGHSMKNIGGRLCNTVTAEDIENPGIKFSIFANRK